MHFLEPRPEHFDAGGVRREGTEIEPSLLADQAEAIKFRSYFVFHRTRRKGGLGQTLVPRGGEIPGGTAKSA